MLRADMKNDATGRGASTMTRPSTDARDGYLVLGMHRSGTSAVAGMLAKLGVSAPATLLPPADDNVKGFWESEKIVAFHDELLASAGSDWNDWREFDPDWRNTPLAATFRTRAIDILQGEFGTSPSFVLKDPRACRFVWFWLDIFADQGIRPLVVLPLRSPLEVAKSLSARDGHPITRSLLVWLRHVLDAECATRDQTRVARQLATRGRSDRAVAGCLLARLVR